MTKDEAFDIAMKEYARTHYPDDCKNFKQGYYAGYEDALAQPEQERVAPTCERCADEREALEAKDWTAIMREGSLVTWSDAEELGERVRAAIRARSGEQK